MKQEILVWKHFNQEAMADLAEAKSARSRREVIRAVLALDARDWRNKEKKIEILVDEYMHCYQYAQKHAFSTQFRVFILFRKTLNFRLF